MADYFFDSRVAPGGIGTSDVSPFVDPSYLPNPWRFESGNRYYFARGAVWNFDSYVTTSGYVAAKITIGAYGDGPRPIIMRKRMVDRAECVEVTMVDGAPGTAANATTDSAGYAIGATVIGLAAAGTGTIEAGGAVQFAGDPNTYRVVSGDADVSTGGSITIEAPGLLVTMTAAPKAITLIWGYTQPASGTNLWRVPAQFYGLFEGDIWGARVDAPHAHAGTVQRLPAAAREWTRADLVSAYTEAPTRPGSHVVYSVGNPVDVYGGLVATNYLDADKALVEKQWCFYLSYLGGGLDFSDIDFEYTIGGIRLWAGENQFTKQRVLIERSECNNARSWVTFYADGDSTYTSGQGFRGMVIRDFKCRNIGASPVLPIGLGTCLNRLRIYNFVVIGCGEAESAGAIYIDHAYCNDGGRMLVYDGTVYGQKRGRFWPQDGYALYQEQYTRDLEFRRCFVWGGEGAACHSNSPGPNNAFVGIVAYSNPEFTGDSWDTFHTGGSEPTGEVTILNCVAINFSKFCQNIDADEGLYRILNNVSRADVSIPAGNRNAVRCYNGYASANLVVDGNNFFGHDKIINDGFSDTDHSADATNGIVSDPAAELARIPIPTDPTVNYALQLSPNFWSGTVDLRPGTRVVT